MIEVINLSKNFAKVKALENLSFTIQKGEIVGFLGVNGSGKTTCMDIICGCSGASSGTVKICGYDICSEAEKAKTHLGYLPDTPPLAPDMTVYESICFAASLRKVAKKDLHTACEEAIDKLDLHTVKKRLISQLSKGFKQRVAFAQAIVHQPEVLVLDEPTDGLDPIQIVEMRKIIQEIGQNYTILLSSHLLAELQNICARLIIIADGKIIRSGTLQELEASIALDHVCKIVVAKNQNKFLPLLKMINGVHKAVYKEDSNYFEFQVKPSALDATLDTVSKKAVSDDYGLRELRIKQQSLEEVFINITN